MEENQNWEEILKFLKPKPALYCPEEPSIPQQAFLRYNGKEALYGGQAGGGKSSALLMAALQYPLEVSTLVPTSSGMKVLKDVEIGDEVYDERGNPVPVVSKTPMHLAESYEVEFDDHTVITASGSHLWGVHSFTDRMSEGGTWYPKTKPLQIKTTNELRLSLKTNHKKSTMNWSIPVVPGGVSGTKTNLPIDPYLFGVWLGDGSKNSGTIAGIDEEIKQSFKDAGYEVTSETSHHWFVKGLRTQLNALGVFRNKHVPEIYLNASREQRLALLQGLMDTDGTCVKKYGNARFFNTNPDIYNPFLRLVSSLGMKPSFSMQKYTTPAGVSKSGACIDFTANDYVFRLERKNANLKIKKIRERIIRDIRLVGKRQVQCLIVDSPTHLFAVTDRFIVTHNCDVPKYSAMLFRRTFADLALPGALMDRFKMWISEHEDVRWNDSTYTATFPSGARISFGYLNNVNDRLRYQGAEFQFVGFDEVTHIRESDYRYLFSRVRKPNSGPLAVVPLRIRSASNPAPNWVRQHFIVEGKEKGRIFVPAALDDNPGVDVESYREMLQGLSPLERQQLEFGDWWASSSGSLFDRNAFVQLSPTEVPEITSAARAVRFWDLAATPVSETNRNPDWTVGTLGVFDQGVFYVLDVKKIRAKGEDVEKLVAKTAEEDGRMVAIRMEIEPGSSGINLIDQYARYVLSGYDFSGIRATGDKVTRARPFASAAANGNVRILQAPWMNDWLDEFSSFPESADHDDQVDSAVGAFTFLAGLGLPQRKRLSIIV